MKKKLLNVVYLFLILGVGSIISTLVIILIYQNKESCPWYLSITNFFDFLVKLIIVKLAIFLLPMFLIFNFYFKNNFNKPALIEVRNTIISFIIIHMGLFAFIKGALGFGLPGCIPMLMKVFIVYIGIVVSTLLLNLIQVSKFLADKGQ